MDKFHSRRIAAFLYFYGLVLVRGTHPFLTTTASCSGFVLEPSRRTFWLPIDLWQQLASDS